MLESNREWAKQVMEMRSGWTGAMGVMYVVVIAALSYCALVQASTPWLEHAALFAPLRGLVRETAVTTWLVEAAVAMGAGALGLRIGRPAAWFGLVLSLTITVQYAVVAWTTPGVFAQWQLLWLPLLPSLVLAAHLYIGHMFDSSLESLIQDVKAASEKLRSEVDGTATAVKPAEGPRNRGKGGAGSAAAVAAAAATPAGRR